MKKALIVILTLLVATFAFAEFSVNHNATLIPQKASTLSGGVQAINLGTWNLEYTQGLKGTNLHVKASYGFRTTRIQGFVRHCILEWNGIDMGFGYGGEVEFRPGNFEIKPLASWNMSYNFNNDVDFYGGFIGGVAFGSNTWSGVYLDIPIGAYYGTQIDIASNLELYMEIQTGILDYAGGAYIGVNYYLSKGLQIEKATKQ